MQRVNFLCLFRRNNVVDAAAHARMAAYAAMVYNANRPAGYPAIAVIPDHAARLAEEINSVVSGSQVCICWRLPRESFRQRQSSIKAQLGQLELAA